MHKAFLYRLYPSKPQRTVGKFEQLRTVKILKATNPYAKNVHSHVLQAVVQDLDKTFQAFFRRVTSGAEKPGFLRFRGRNRFRSFGFKELGNGFKIDGRRLKLSGIGRVAVRWHRPWKLSSRRYASSKGEQMVRLLLVRGGTD